MQAMHSHRDLPVWQKSIALAGKVYTATRALPDAERDGLTQQSRRCAVAVASQIAAGAARGRRAEFIQFLRLARASLTELETHVLIAERLGVLAGGALDEDIRELQQMLAASIRRLSEARSFERVVRP